MKREREAIKHRFENGGLFYHLFSAKADRQRAQKIRLQIENGEGRAWERVEAVQRQYDTDKAEVDRRYEEAKRAEDQRLLSREFPAPEQQRAERQSLRGEFSRSGPDRGRERDDGPEFER